MVKYCQQTHQKQPREPDTSDEDDLRDQDWVDRRVP